MTITQINERARQQPTPHQLLIGSIMHATGKTERAVRAWLCGQRIPDKSQRATIADTLGRTADELWAGCNLTD